MVAEHAQSARGRKRRTAWCPRVPAQEFVCSLQCPCASLGRARRCWLHPGLSLVSATTIYGTLESALTTFSRFTAWRGSQPSIRQRARPSFRVEALCAPGEQLSRLGEDRPLPLSNGTVHRARFTELGELLSLHRSSHLLNHLQVCSPVPLESVKGSVVRAARLSRGVATSEHAW